MNAFATLALLGWVPAMLLVCATTPIRVGLLIAGIGGWLLLPEAGLELSGLPDYTKTFAINLALLGGASIFARQQLWAVGWTLWDLPICVLVAAPFCSALANGTGAYDAWTSLFSWSVNAFVPYWIGRAFFNTPASARLLLYGIFVGGLCYVLPCLYEVRFSPMLHIRVYGFFQHSWLQMVRSGGYRPIVFTPHGLAVALWMSIATLAGIALWRRLGVRSAGGLPMPYLVGVLALTVILCKSLGALVLLMAGAWLLWSSGRRTWLLWLLLSGPIYIAASILGAEWVYPMLEYVLAHLPEERAGSFWYRVHNEAVLIERGWLKPVFGWSPRYFLLPIEDEYGEPVSLTCDSMWVISFTAYGFIGLLSQFGVLMLPAIRVLQLNRGAAHFDRTLEFTALAGIITILMLDSVSNSFMNTVYLLAIGAVVGARHLTTEPVNETVPAQVTMPAGYRGHSTAATLRPRPARRLDQ